MLRIALTLLLLTSLAFCRDEAATARSAAGCGPRAFEFNVDTAKSRHPIAQPDPGKALVYVFAEPMGPGSPTTRVGVDGTWIGANRGKSYFFFNVEPGEHQVCSDRQSAYEVLSNIGSAVTFIAEAGKTYYFRARLETRFDFPSYLEIETVGSAQGMFLISSSPLAKFTPKK